MSSEIRTHFPTSQISQAGRSQAAPLTSSVQFLDSLPRDVAAGQQLQAQIVAVRENAKMFELLLRLQMPDGREVKLKAQSDQPQMPGQSVVLTATHDRHFSLTTISRSEAAALSALQLQDRLPTQVSAGQQLQAQVVAVRETAQQQYNLQLQVRLPDGQTVSVQAQSNQSHSPGQNLTLTALNQQQFSLAAPAPRNEAAVPQALQVLDPLPRSVQPGQQLQAQVLQVQHSAQHQYSVQLRLQLPGGQAVNVQAQSNQPPAAGQNITLTALGQQQFSLSAVANTAPAAQPAAPVLQILEPLPRSLAGGQQINAQVVGLREIGPQQFSLQLKVQVPGGQSVTLQAQTNQPQAVGQPLALTALGNQQFSLANNSGLAAPRLASFDPAQYPPGSQIQARVVQVEAMTRGDFRITMTLNSGSQAGQQFTVEAARPLAINSLVTAQVEGRFELNLIPAQNSFQQLAVQQELGEQFIRQGSPAQALQQLLQLVNSHSETLASLSPVTQKLVQQMVDGMPELGSRLDAKQLADIIRNSGIQMESRLHADQASPQDLKANLLRLITQLLPQQAHANPLTAGAQAAIVSQALPQLLRELGGPVASLREQALRFPVTSRVLERLENPNDLGSLLRLAAAAISRLQTHQLASLAQTYTTSEGTQVTTWQTEIPMRQQEQVVPLQVKFQQEQHSSPDPQHNQPPVWRLELSFDIEPLGPMHAQVNLQEDNLSSRLWAEHQKTVSLVKKELHVLRDKLLAAGLNIRELECEQGMPPAPPKALIERRWIDDLA